MNPAMDNTKKEIAPSERGLKNLMQKMFKRSRKNKYENSSCLCTSSLPETSCSSNETIAFTRSTKKEESPENSWNIIYIGTPKEISVDGTNKLDISNTKINYTVEEIESHSVYYFSVEGVKTSLGDVNTTLNEEITQTISETPKQIEEPVEPTQEESANIQEWHEILTQWEIIDDIPEIGLEALEWRPDEPTIDEQDINVNPERHDANLQELNVVTQSHDVSVHEIHGDAENHDINEQDIDMNPEMHDINVQEINVVLGSHDVNEQEIDVDPESHDVNAQQIDVNLERHDVTVQEIDVVPDNRDVNEHEIRGDQDSHDINKQEIDVDPENRNIDEQKIDLDAESHNINEKEIYVNPESHEDNEFSTDLKNSSRTEKQEEFHVVCLQGCSISSEPWEYQYEKYTKMYSNAFAKRHGYNGSSANRRNSSCPVKKRASRIMYPLRYPIVLRKLKCQYRMRRIISLETLEEEPTGNEVERVNPNNIRNNMSLIEERVPIPDRVEQNEASLDLENVSCMKKQKSCEAIAPQKCFATLDKRETQYENIIDAFSKTLQTESFFRFFFENVEYAKTFGASEGIDSQHGSATLKKSDFHYEDSINLPLETLANEFKESAHNEIESLGENKSLPVFENVRASTSLEKKESVESTDNEQERAGNPVNLEEDKSLPFLENVDCEKTEIYSEAVALQKYFVTLDKIETESKEIMDNDEEKVMNPDEENESLFVLENAGCSKKCGAPEASAPHECSATLEKVDFHYENSVNSSSEMQAKELKESKNNEKEIFVSTDSLEENSDNLGEKESSEFSEAEAPYECSVTLETCKAQYINRNSKTLKNESKEPTERAVYSESHEDIDNSNDLGDVSSRPEREAAGSSNRDQSYLRRHTIFVIFYLLSLLFILWVVNNSMLKI